jgi:DNA polymerase III alpha subunit (gram-positive type)
MKKVLWFDTETTGLNPVKNDIVQIAGIIEVDGEVVEKFNIKCQPTSYDDVQPRALEVHGMTIDQIKQFQTAQEGWCHFITIIKKYKGVKLIPAGHNIPFDIKFLAQWFIKNGSKMNIYDYLSKEVIDTLLIAKSIPKHVLKTENHKLVTLAAHFDIPIDAHDALSDIEATKEVYGKLNSEFEVKGNA